MADHVRALIIEGQPKDADLLRRGLTQVGFAVETRKDGESGLKAALERPPCLVIVSVVLSGMEGFEVCRRLRAGGPVPMLMLTAGNSVADRVRDLNSGADDIMLKPFHFDELLARLRALLRRWQPREVRILCFDDLMLDATTRQLRRGSRPIQLSTNEFDLLYFLMRHPRQVLTFEVICGGVRGHKSSRPFYVLGATFVP